MTKMFMSDGHPWRRSGRDPWRMLKMQQNWRSR